MHVHLSFLFSLGSPASLTRVIISISGIAALLEPIGTIVRFVSTTPHGVFVASDLFRPPRTITRLTTKTMFLFMFAISPIQPGNWLAAISAWRTPFAPLFGNFFGASPPHSSTTMTRTGINTIVATVYRKFLAAIATIFSNESALLAKGTISSPDDFLFTSRAELGTFSPWHSANIITHCIGYS